MLRTYWMRSIGMTVFRGRGGQPARLLCGESIRMLRGLLIGSHLDTVPNAGAFDGILWRGTGHRARSKAWADASTAVFD